MASYYKNTNQICASSGKGEAVMELIGDSIRMAIIIFCLLLFSAFIAAVIINLIEFLKRWFSREDQDKNQDQNEGVE